MKKVSLILIVCFLFAAMGVNTASAQSSQTGYIPLLSEGYDTSVPRQQLSIDRLTGMLPLLEKAKQKGVITSFEPDLYGGFVTIKYAGEMHTENALTMPVYSSMQEAVVPAPSPMISANVTDTASSASAYVSLYSNCYSITNAGANAKVKAQLYISGSLTGSRTSNTNSSGYLWDCLSGIYSSMIPGSLVKFTIYNASGVYQKTISTTLPRITFTSLDQTNAIVKGTAVAGKAYAITWYQDNYDSGHTSTNKVLSGTVPSTGAWSVDFGTQKILGRATIDFNLIYSSSLTIDFSFVAPALSCGLRNNYCYLYSLPNKDVSMTILHGIATYKYSGKSNYWGYFTASVTNSYGDPVFLNPGDTISGTGATTFKMPTITATINPTADTVTGTAPANTYFIVEIYPFAENNWYIIYTHSGSNGAYTANYSGWVDIPVEDVLAEIDYVNKTTGNLTYLDAMK